MRSRVGSQSASVGGLTDRSHKLAVCVCLRFRGLGHSGVNKLKAFSTVTYKPLYSSIVVLHHTLHFQMMWSELLEEDVRSLSSLIKHSACMNELILVLA